MTPAMTNDNIGLMIHADAGLGVLHELTGVIARHRGDITSVEIIDQGSVEARIYFEIALPGSGGELAADLRALAIVRKVEVVETLQKIYGKRIIIMGGGAQVGQFLFAHQGDGVHRNMFAADVVTVGFGDRAYGHLAHLRAAAHDDDALAVYGLERLDDLYAAHDG